MTILNLTYQERLEFQNILPIMGNLETLELVDRIIRKVKINDKQEMQNNKSAEYNFENEEINFLQNIIQVRSSQQQLNFSSLSLIRKILNIKEKMT